MSDGWQTGPSEIKENSDQIVLKSVSKYLVVPGIFSIQVSITIVHYFHCDYMQAMR